MLSMLGHFPRPLVWFSFCGLKDGFFFQELGHVRIRQHVNPLSSSFSVSMELIFSFHLIWFICLIIIIIIVEACSAFTQGEALLTC